MLSRLVHGIIQSSRSVTCAAPNSLVCLTQAQRYRSEAASTTTTEKVSETKQESTGGEGENKGGSRWSKWTGKNAWKLGLIFLSGTGVTFGGGIIYLWGEPQKDDEGHSIKDKYSDYPAVIAYCIRAFNECLTFNQSIRDPVSDRLLPDMLQPPYYQPPYTLVIEMSGVLVHPDWTFKTGWRFKKRPALDVFMQSVSPYFEVVCFTHESAMTAAPILQQIDPKGQFLHYRLFRESTRYRAGEHIKDLSCLNRPLNRVIVVDWNSGAFQLHPRNALKVPKWRGDEEDKELLDLAAFLRMVAMSGVDDVRSVLEFYSQFDNPLEVFKDKQTQLMEEQARRKEETEQRKSSKQVSSWGFRGFNRR